MKTINIIQLVEDCEALAIAAGEVEAKDIQTRSELRVSLLDTFSQVQRARRVAALLDRLHREVQL